MTPQHHRLITDNPNLQTNTLARFLGLDKATVRKARESAAYRTKGCGIPFLTRDVYHGGLRYVIAYRGRKLGNGSFSYCMEQLDRLIYALENGGLPPTFNEWIFNDLEYLHATEEESVDSFTGQWAKNRQGINQRATTKTNTGLQRHHEAQKR